MKKYELNVPVEIRFGCGAVRENPAMLKLGRRAAIVTGKNSGRLSGALQDVAAAMAAQNVEYELFDCIGNNPDVEQTREVGARAREFKADFVVGVGGGSPLDAAKAVAVFAAQDIPVEQLFKNEYEAVLPIAAVPTTSGTGSEVTPWSIMTRRDKCIKSSFGCDKTFPKVALLDPRYTDSLPLDITRDTAVDAFTHCLESMIATKATAETDEVNLEAIAKFGGCMAALEAGSVAELRQTLMEVSMLGGSTIARTGTTMMHAMAYPLTYFYGVPHGRANAMVMPVYLDEVEKHRGDRLQRALSALGCDKQTLQDYVRRMFPLTVRPKAEELRLWAQQTAARKVENSTGVPGGEEYMLGLYGRLFK